MPNERGTILFVVSELEFTRGLRAELHKLGYTLCGIPQRILASEETLTANYEIAVIEITTDSIDRTEEVNSLIRLLRKTQKQKPIIAYVEPQAYAQALDIHGLDGLFLHHSHMAESTANYIEEKIKNPSRN